MGKKKTTFTWILLVLIAIWLVFGVINFIGGLFMNSLFSGLTTITTLLTVASLVISAIYLFKLYNVKPDVIKWTDITFGFALGTYVLGLIIGLLTIGPLVILGAIFTAPIVLIIYILPWIGIRMHLKRAKRENLMDFS